MSSSFFFYDLETSGINPRGSRIMQFAGQRTDMQLKPIGEPYNFLIRLSEDVLPDPWAVMITGITPQKTFEEGISEADFFKIFYEEIVQPETIFTGFNSIRFDDEFMRYSLYRNFYDPYAWQWLNNSSRWDILDLVRMTRALRPSKINWPFAPDGKPTNRLELLTELNKLDHFAAHDALSDVYATIAVANMIKTKQPKLFDFVLGLRTKREVQKFIEQEKTFIYVSGKYSSEHEKLAVVQALGNTENSQGALVYNLLVEPSPYLNMTTEQLVGAWRKRPDPEKIEDFVPFPVKVLQYNRCPAIAPLSVLGREDAKRLNIDQRNVDSNVALLNKNPDFIQNVKNAHSLFNEQINQQEMIVNPHTVDELLYKDFISDFDRKICNEIVNSRPEELSEFADKLKDDRLKVLLQLYKARNFSKSLNHDEKIFWENYKKSKLENEIPAFMQQYESALVKKGITKNERYVLEELRLYVESLVDYS